MSMDGAPMEDGKEPVIEAYKKDVDRTLIRENLKLTVDQRLQNLESQLRDLNEMREAMRRAQASRRAASVTSPARVDGK